MTKKIGPEQEEHLKKLTTARKRLQRLRAKEDDAMREVHTLIRDGFHEYNISGLKLATASGLSLPRVYQVRNEEPNDVAGNGEAPRSESAAEAVSAVA